MYKVLVYSEDKLIGVGISHTLFWERIGYTVVQTASNPLDLKKLYKIHEPDLIVINYQSIDDDQNSLIKKFIDEYSKSEIIAIGTRGDNHYINSIIGLGILDYIERDSLSPELLYEKLRSYEEVLARKNKLSVSSDKKIQKDISLAAQSQILKELLYGKRLGIDVNNSVLRNFEISFPYNDFVVFVTKIEDVVGDYRNKSTVRFYQEIVDNGGIVYISNSSINELSFIYNFRQNSRDDITYRVERMGAKILGIIKKYYDVSKPVFVSESFNHVSDIGKAYLQCLMSIRSNRVVTANLLIYYKDKQYTMSSESIIPLNKLLTQLKFSLKEKDVVKVKLTLSSFVNELHKIEYIELTYLKYIITSIIFILNDFRTKFGIAEDIFWGIDYKPIKNIDFIESKDDFVDYINIFEIKITEILTSNEKSNVYITRMKDFVKKNYMGDINLTDLARELELTTSYISSMFKKNTGETYKDYLINYRLLKAKELLTETNMQISQVSENIGYENEHYFSKIFKIKIGITPSHYRNTHQK